MGLHVGPMQKDCSPSKIAILTFFALFVCRGTFAKENGGGFLTDHYPRASKAIWDIEGIYCSSRHIPGVRFAGLIHPGLIGTAPSEELLKIWNDRESALCAEEGTPQEKTLCGCLLTRPLACLPEAKGAMLGKLGHFKAKQGADETWDKIAGEAARTVPGRENGGNCDIKNLSRGCSVYFPVFVPGAKLSMGDMHFSQGDGEVSFCGAIEMVRMVFSVVLRKLSSRILHLSTNFFIVTSLGTWISNAP